MNFLPRARTLQINSTGRDYFFLHFIGLPSSGFSVLAIFAETRVGKVMENTIRMVCVYIWSTCKCSAGDNGCFLSRRNKKNKKADTALSVSMSPCVSLQ